MPVYTVKNNANGQTVKFQWNELNPPTDTDIQQVFDAVAKSKPAERPFVGPPEPPNPVQQWAENAGRAVTNEAQGFANRMQERAGRYQPDQSAPAPQSISQMAQNRIPADQGPTGARPAMPWEVANSANPPQPSAAPLLKAANAVGGAMETVGDIPVTAVKMAYGAFPGPVKEPIAAVGQSIKDMIFDPYQKYVGQPFAQATAPAWSAVENAINANQTAKDLIRDVGSAVNVAPVPFVGKAASTVANLPQTAMRAGMSDVEKGAMAAADQFHASGATGPSANESTASSIAQQIDNSVDPKVGTVDIPGVGTKRMKDVTMEDLRAAVENANVPPDAAPDVAQSISQQLQKDMPKLRRDIANQPLTAEEIRQAQKGEFDQPLQAAGSPLEQFPVKQSPGLGALGREMPDRAYHALSEPKAPTTPDFPTMLDYAENYKRTNDPSVNPRNVATKASLEGAFQNFDSQISKLANQKELLLTQSTNSGKQVNISDIKNEWISAVTKVARADLVQRETTDAAGNKATGWALEDRPGQSIKIDPDSDQAILDITNKLMAQPDLLNPKVADDLKRFIQHKRYSQMGIVPDIADRLSKQFSDILKNRLIKELGPRYSNINANLHDFIGMEQDLAKSLGRPVDIENGLYKNAAAVMKRAENSDVATDVQNLFKKIKDLSSGHYDPQQAASYAQIAMMAVNDDRAFGPFAQRFLGGEMPTSPEAVAKMAAKHGAEIVGKIASGGKDKPAFLTDYWRKAQAKYPKKEGAAPTAPDILPESEAKSIQAQIDAQKSAPPPPKEPPAAAAPAVPVPPTPPTPSPAAASVKNMAEQVPAPGSPNEPQWLKDARAAGIPPVKKKLTDPEIADRVIEEQRYSKLMAGLPPDVTRTLFNALHDKKISIPKWKDMVNDAKKSIKNQTQGKAGK